MAVRPPAISLRGRSLRPALGGGAEGQNVTEAGAVAVLQRSHGANPSATRSQSRRVVIHSEYARAEKNGRKEAGDPSVSGRGVLASNTNSWWRAQGAEFLDEAAVAEPGTPASTARSSYVGAGYHCTHAPRSSQAARHGAVPRVSPSQFQARGARPSASHGSGRRALRPGPAAATTGGSRSWRLVGGATPPGLSSAISTLIYSLTASCVLNGTCEYPDILREWRCDGLSPRPRCGDYEPLTCTRPGRGSRESLPMLHTCRCSSGGFGGTVVRLLNPSEPRARGLYRTQRREHWGTAEAVRETDQYTRRGVSPAWR